MKKKKNVDLFQNLSALKLYASLKLKFVNVIFAWRKNIESVILNEFFNDSILDGLRQK